ncbi:hypothetical protein dsx2_0992 [Desulfovibrio sp. X2]|uniref:hypothetical protein n=1 Tax=Desulfovibrio sp. X2 TaxID=941449 RepID=UPI000358BDAE|nr:hypothetical protein [Desulfovibrio sp. X2]EPR37049.1 hypothetical protein dsx2_0992 [Desulfovibrio sp. X2]
MLQIITARTSELSNLGPVRHEDAVFVLPFIDGELAHRLADVLVRRALHSGLLVLVEDDERLGFMKVANFVCSRSSSRYFGYLAQDAFPSDGWLRAALATMDSTGGSLLAFNDGRFHGTLAVFGMARRTWLEGLYHKFLFFPGYQSHFGDTELSAIAIHQDSLVYNPGCVMLEVDYEKHRKGNNPDDEALYRTREAGRFGGLI